MARTKQTARRSVAGGALIVKTIGRNRRPAGRAVRLPPLSSFQAGGEDQSEDTDEDAEQDSFQAGGDDQSEDTDEDAEQEWFVGWRGEDYGERESFQHPEASWAAHWRRREEDYEQEMEHAFGNWGGIGGTRINLVDESDLDGTPLYDPRDPDPDWPGTGKVLRPFNEFYRLIDLLPKTQAAQLLEREYDSFFLFPERNLNDRDDGGDDWAGRLRGRINAVPGNDETKNRMLWVIDYCLERDGLMN